VLLLNECLLLLFRYRLSPETFGYTFIHTYIHTHTHTHTYIHTYIHTYTHTHTYIHTYIHTHTHTICTVHLYKMYLKVTLCTFYPIHVCLVILSFQVVSVLEQNSQYLTEGFNSKDVIPFSKEHIFIFLSYVARGGSGSV